MNMQLRALRRRDWLQQYANAKILQKFAKVFANVLQVFGAFIHTKRVYVRLRRRERDLATPSTLHE